MYNALFLVKEPDILAQEPVQVLPSSLINSSTDKYIHNAYAFKQWLLVALYGELMFDVFSKSLTCLKNYTCHKNLSWNHY